MKKVLVSLLLGTMMMASTVFAAENDIEWRAQQNAGQGYYVENLTEEEIAALTETTIIKDENSITGYTVTFRHYAPDAKRVRIRGEWSLYQRIRNSMFPGGPYTPDEWTDAMFPLQVNVADWPAFDMEKNEETGVWFYTIPLPSGTWSYRFIEDGVEGAALTDYTDAFQTTDVNNRPWEKELGEQGNSQVRVPFDGMKQSKNFSLQMPRTDGQVGVTEILLYEAEGFAELRDDPAVAVYLPYGYNPERQTPYKVLYISHGAGQESETSWYNKGSMANVTDNLIATGLVEPMVVVIINNFATNFNEDNFVNNIVPAVEANYNVATTADGKAVAGLSAGSMFTRRVAVKYTDQFGTYGFFSAGGVENYPEELKDANLYIGTGYYDTAYNGMVNMMNYFDEHGFDYESLILSGGHDWNLWRQVYVDFVMRCLWK